MLYQFDRSADQRRFIPFYQLFFLLFQLFKQVLEIIWKPPSSIVFHRKRGEDFHR